MATVPGYLPLLPGSRFTPEALEQLAAGVVDKPILACPGGDPVRDRIGTVTAAEVEGERVRFTAELSPRELEGVPLEFGAELLGKRKPGGAFTAVDRVIGVNVRPGG